MPNRMLVELAARKRHILEMAQGMIETTAAKVKADGGEYVILLCDLESELGKRIASLSDGFDPKEGMDLWIYALKTEEFIELMGGAGKAVEEDTRARLRKGQLQMVLFTDGAPHWYTLRENGQDHWAALTLKTRSKNA